MNAFCTRFLLFIFCLILGFSISFSEEVEINIIHINDSHSNLLPGKGRDENLKSKHGGLARAVTIIGIEKIQDPETLLLHAGDFSVGDLLWYLNFGIPEIATLKSLGLDAMTIGNHEFDAGTVNLSTLLMTANQDYGDCNFLSANLVANEGYSEGYQLKQEVKDYIIKDVKGVKVGIFGMTSGSANMTSIPYPEITVDENYVIIANEQVAKLQDAGCDVIIFLSHLGSKNDMFVAEQTKGIHLIIGGHDHMTTYQPIIVPYDEEHSTYIVQAGAFYESIGGVRITVNDGQITEIKNRIIDLTIEIPEDPAVAASLDYLISELPADVKVMFDTQIAYSSETLTEIVPDVLGAYELSSEVGCLISAAFKEWGGTDIGFTTGGLSAQPLYEGPIVGNDIIRMLGYGVNEYDGVGYNMVKFNIKGSDLYMGILYTLMMSWGAGDDEFFPQVSGIQINFEIGHGGEMFIEIDGVTINLEEYYSLTTTVFVAGILTDFLEIPITDYTLFEENSDFIVLLDFVANLQNITPELVACENIRPFVGDDVPEIINADVSFSPNPASELVNITVNSAMSGNYDVMIYDYRGMKVSLKNSYFLDGELNQLSVNTSSLPNGAYLVKVSNGKISHTGKLIISR
ncbi:MAG: 5'-nucleotidase C-terminal domain-containing protein [Candidatus Kapabacteria bacterium]|nr:5'-nucleotidase C-terminal domain-containing protein [Candidatus Kapabacteria bacterium]